MGLVARFRKGRSPVKRLLAAALAAIFTAAAGCAVPAASNGQAQSAVDHYAKGQLLKNMGMLDAALAELARAVEADPKLTTAHAAIGDIHRLQNRLPQAVGAYERAVASNPHNFRNHYNCGFLHQMMADAATAAKSAQRHLTRAVQLYLGAVALRASDYDALLNLGVCYYRLGDYERAEGFCKRAIAVNGDLPDAYTNLGAVYDRQNRPYKAISMYRRSLECDTQQGDVLMNLAAVYVKQDKLNSAMRTYRMVMEMRPDDPSPLERLGYCHYFKGDYEKAQELYRQALAKDSRHAPTHRGLGVVYMTRYLLGPKSVQLRDRALAEWQISMELNPNQPALLKLIDKYAPKIARSPL